MRLPAVLPSLVASSLLEERSHVLPTVFRGVVAGILSGRTGVGARHGRPLCRDSSRDAPANPTDGRSGHRLFANRKRQLAENAEMRGLPPSPMPLWALSEADRNGYSIDKKYLAETFESLLGSHDKLLASKIFPNPADRPDPRPQGPG